MREKLKDEKSVERREFPGRMEEGNNFPHTQKRALIEVTNYRGVTLLCLAYKLYAAVFTERRKETEEKSVLPKSQAGFRKGRGTTYLSCM